MADVTIEPGRLQGRVDAPPSKSAAHRAVILSALGKGTGVLSPVDMSDDVAATVAGAVALGAHCAVQKGTLRVTGITPVLARRMPLIDCHESGSTLRFLLPAALVAGGGAHFVGRGRLGQRPMKPYEDICRRQGIVYEHAPSVSLDLKVEGKLRAGEFALPGDVSSQFISGLLMALPLLKGDSRIRLTGPVESSGYIDMTVEMLEAFGARVVRRDEHTYDIPGGQFYKGRALEIEGDYSQAAVFLCADALGSRVSVGALRYPSRQADQAVLDHLMRMGADIARTQDGVRVCAAALHAAQIDASQCPDIVPMLALVAALSEGTSRIVGAARLRLKESDRLEATCQELNRLGARVSQTADGLVIEGVTQFRGGVTCDCHGDHRIAMMLCVAALHCAAPVSLSGVACLSKSYPGFLVDFQKLGGVVRGRNLG